MNNAKILRGGIPLLFFIVLLLGWIASDYIHTDTSFIIGLMMLPYLAIIQKGGRKGGLYTILAIISLIGSIYLPTRTLHFFTLAFALLAYTEMQWGCLNILPLFAVVFMSSLVTNFSLVFSFPIRLKISILAAKGLTLFDPKAVAEGNIIHFRGTDFSVDTACMGLIMLQMSLLLALFLIAYFEREKQVIFTPLSIFTILVTGLGLNVFFNLLRIILLVLFGWMPETFMHDAAGVVGLGLYVFLPLYFIVKKGASLGAKRKDTFIIDSISKSNFPKIRNFLKEVSVPLKYLFTTFLLGFLTYISLFEIHDKKPFNAPTLLTIKYLEDTHCPKTQAKDGILKYDNGEILVYLKPIPGFYAAEHSPMICWLGSGYTFGQVKSETIGNMEIYTGTLKKGHETLQTAWWYDNGKTQTASQITWRTAILKGEPHFNLVNITAADSVTLRLNIAYILQ